MSSGRLAVDLLTSRKEFLHALENLRSLIVTIERPASGGGGEGRDSRLFHRLESVGDIRIGILTCFLSCRPSPTGDREATTSPVLVSPSLLLCLAAAQAAAGKAARPQGRRRRGFVLTLGHGRGTYSRAAEPARSMPPTGSGGGPAAGLSGVAAVSGGGGSGVEALAAAAEEETARSAPGSGGTAAGGGVWWRGWRRRRGWQGDDVDEVNLAAPAVDPAPGGLAVATVVATTTAAQATTAGRLRRVSSLDDDDKVREDDEMAAGMEGWRGDGVGEANLAAPAAEPTPEESGCRGDGGDELASTAARATTVGGLRRVPSELDDGEKGREDAKYGMADLLDD
uniref:Uncharacterized protein n=1 Tax=Oryza glumipatula TaxID=40148 RepID=A0A0E0BNZ1_9ORYZ